MKKYQTLCKVNRFIDGDTFECLMDLGFGVMIIQDIRLMGVNAPEITGKDKKIGIIVRDRIESVLKGHDLYVITRKKAFGDDGERSFTRWVGEFYDAKNKKPLNDLLQKHINKLVKELKEEL